MSGRQSFVFSSVAASLQPGSVSVSFSKLSVGGAGSGSGRVPPRWLRHTF